MDDLIDVEIEVKKGKKVDDEALCSLIRSHFALDEEFNDDNRNEAEYDIRFRNGEQWDSDTEISRANKPMLVSNHCNQYIYNVVNEIQQSPPEIKVQPVDDGADVKTAEIRQGIIRNIEQLSNAQVIYENGAEQAVEAGFGFWRVNFDWSDDNSFEKDIRILPIPNRFSVALDPHSILPDGSDAMWGGIIDTMTRADYREAFPDSEVASFQGFDGKYGDWILSDSIRVAEYFCVKHVDATLLLLDDGTKLFDDDPNIADYMDRSIVDKRTVKRRKVSWYLTNGIEILDRKDWPGIYIPIIPVYGNHQFIDGKWVNYGLIRNLRDPQKLINYWKSIEAEFLSKVSKAPWVGAKGVFDGEETAWANAHLSDTPFLEYNQKDVEGAPAPRPERLQFPVPPTGILQAIQEGIDDMKAVTGMYENSLGATGNETSGRAIIARQQQGNTATFHYRRNLNIAVRYTGVVINDLIPKVMNKAKVQRIIGEDGSIKTVTINKPFVDEKTGKTLIYDMTIGKYDIIVTTGPAFASRREYALDGMMRYITANPQSAGLYGDLIAKSSDWPYANEFAARAKAMLPPEVRDLDTEGDAELQAVKQQAQQAMEQLNAQAQEAMGQAQAQIQQLTQELEMLKAGKEMDAQKARADYEIKMGELELKQKELELKENEFLLKRAEIKGKIDFEMDVATREKELALEGVRVETEALERIEAEKTALEAEKLRLEQEENERLAQLATAQKETLETLKGIKEAILKPATIVRSPDGKVQGIKKV